VIGIEIQAGRVIKSTFTPYVKQDGDTTREVRRKNDGGVNELLLKRGGQEIGWLIGPNREWLVTKEKFEGDPLLTFVADDKAEYSVSIDGQTVKPLAVYRKSKPNDWAQGLSTQSVRHVVYLKLPQALKPNQKVEINFGEVNVREASTSFVNYFSKLRSEAVHVNQIGYRPDDNSKRAFVSCWLGTGGTLHLTDELSFSIIDVKTGKAVWSGKSTLVWRADKIEQMARDDNFSKTDVATLDFSSFKTPGEYRIAVEGFGCSYPFEIGNDVWRKAFTVQMRGLFHQRSGMELGPPYTDFKKPRDMHPADGFPVFKTNVRWVEKGGETLEEIRKNATTQKVLNAWGGYHDAGDWNPRRVTHLKATMASLEVFEMFPEYFSKIELNIPKTKGVPDILTEAMWEVDCFKRLQTSDGGVPYGIESGLGDPAEGEVSWLNSFPSYVFAPDYYNSWYYAASAARLAEALAPYDAKNAGEYRVSAIAAFDFAEKDFARDKAAGLMEKRNNTWEAIDNRNLAVLELYRLTREKKYHDVFLEDTVLNDEKPELFAWSKHVQREQAFIYASLPKHMGYENLKTKALAALETMAQRALEYSGNNAFNLTTPDKGKPQFLGFYSTPDAWDLTRAHYLTKKPEYLAGALKSTQFQSGCNPSNLVYTTGLGGNPVLNTFKLDARRTGQKVPEGLTPYGNVDLAKWGGQNFVNWPITWFVGKDTTPDAYSWPVNEAYWDVGGWPALNEFTVDTWAPNIQVWGYLAARDALKP
jgi:endoglucanase